MKIDKVAAKARLEIWEKNNRGNAVQGYGWCGWWGEHFFRSIRELSYIIDYLEPQRLRWQTGEDPKYAIAYVDRGGATRNYFVDFVVQNKFLVECKPISQWDDPMTLTKKEAAELYAKRHGYVYTLVDPPQAAPEKIIGLWRSGKVVFTPETEKLFRERFNLNEETEVHYEQRSSRKREEHMGKRLRTEQPEYRQTEQRRCSDDGILREFRERKKRYPR